MATLSVDSDEFSLQHTALFKQVPADQVKELMQYLHCLLYTSDAADE